MSLSTGKSTAKNQIKQVLEDMMTREDSSTDEFAERLTNILEEWLQKATIRYINGLTAPNGPVVGTFNGKLE